MLVACGNQFGVPKTKLNTVSTSVGIPSSGTCTGSQMVATVNFASDAVVKDLISASIDPSLMGTIENVDLTFNIVFDRNHQIISSRSIFRLVITDSLVGQPGPGGDQIEPVEIVHALGSTVSGNWDSATRRLNLTFQDSYGRIELVTDEQDEDLVGSIQFQNSTSWDGSQPKSGTLGSFTARPCQFQ